MQRKLLVNPSQRLSTKGQWNSWWTFVPQSAVTNNGPGFLHSFCVSPYSCWRCTLVQSRKSGSACVLPQATHWDSPVLNVDLCHRNKCVHGTGASWWSLDHKKSGCTQHSRRLHRDVYMSLYQIGLINRPAESWTNQLSTAWIKCALLLLIPTRSDLKCDLWCHKFCCDVVLRLLSSDTSSMCLRKKGKTFHPAKKGMSNVNQMDSCGYWDFLTV